MVMVARDRIEPPRSALVELNALLAFLERKPAESAPQIVQIFKRCVRVVTHQKQRQFRNPHAFQKSSPNPTFSA